MPIAVTLYSFSFMMKWKYCRKKVITRKKWIEYMYIGCKAWRRLINKGKSVGESMTDNLFQLSVKCHKVFSFRSFFSCFRSHFEAHSIDRDKNVRQIRTFCKAFEIQHKRIYLKTWHVQHRYEQMLNIRWITFFAIQNLLLHNTLTRCQILDDFLQLNNSFSL